MDELKRPPLSQMLGFGAGTFVTVGAVDLLAHLGPTGLVVGGIAAYVASRHGSELIGQIKGALPAIPARRQESMSLYSTKRSIADRALGRFPLVVHVDETERGSAAFTEDEEGQGFDEAWEQPAPRVVQLASNLALPVNEVIDAGIFASGMKGSGKSELAARIMEQIGTYPIPQIIYDLKGDFVSLVQSDPPYFQNGLIMTAYNIYAGETILSCGLQVVVDLRTWPDMESRAEVIARLNSELLKYAMSLSEDDRFPWFVHLDEAQQFVSQYKPVGIETATWKWVTQSVTNLGVLGRAYGAVPCLYTQRIADIHKDVISQQELRVFMKAALDNDLKRYEEYVSAKIATRETIQSFRAGDAVVILPDGKQIITRFLQRESKHGSHTPHLTAALERRFQPFPAVSEAFPKRFRVSDDPLDGSAPFPKRETASVADGEDIPLPNVFPFPRGNNPSIQGESGTGNETRETIKRMHRKGMPLREIALLVGLSGRKYPVFQQICKEEHLLDRAEEA